MSGFAEDGYAKPGKIGSEEHVGDPLTIIQLGCLQPDTEVVVTWFGGNGPHRYRVVNDERAGLALDLLEGSVPHDPHWPTPLKGLGGEFWHKAGLNRVTLATTTNTSEKS